MKSSILNTLFTGSSTFDFPSLLNTEAEVYARVMSKRGSGIHLVFQEDEDVHIDNFAIRRLLQERLNGRISSTELAYICDCLTLGERVDYSDEEIKDIVFRIADPEINGYADEVEIQSLINRLTHLDNISKP